MNGEGNINGPAFMGKQSVAEDTTALTSYIPVPGFGVLPVNAFVIHAREPVLVDTGLAALESDFIRALRETINPAELRWIWITHADADHIGNLHAVLRTAPRAMVITNFLGMGKLAMQGVPAEIVNRQLGHFHKADPAYAAGVAGALEVEWEASGTYPNEPALA